ncbi:MAG: integration host factor subunit beta [Myxococcaceae bacterium]
MTKSQLIELIAERAPRVPRREIERIVNAVFDSMSESLQEGERIEIRGFGSFGVKTRPARQGRNPKTGEQVSVPLRRTPFFTVGKELKDRLNPELEQHSGEEDPLYTSNNSSEASTPESMVAAPPRYES